MFSTHSTTGELLCQQAEPVGPVILTPAFERAPRSRLAFLIRAIRKGGITMNGNVLRRLLTGLTLLALAFPGWAARPTQAVVLATAPFAVQSVPRGTISMQNASAIATGWRHTCLLTGNGGVECWGYNLSGQLGDGTTLNRGTPAFVAGLASNVAAVDGGSGSAHTCAVTSAGGVKCWGFNTFGQLGDGTTADR